MDGSTTGPASGEAGVGARTGGTAADGRSQLDDAQNTARERIAEVRQQAAQQVSKARDTVKEEIRTVKDDVEHRAADRVNRQKHQVADRMDAMVHALDAAGSSLRDDGQDQISGFVDDLGRQVARSTGYLRNNDFHGMVRDMEQLARGNTALFLGSTFVAGVAMGRFLRASEPQPERTGSEFATSPSLGNVNTFDTPRSAGLGTTGAGTSGAGVDELNRGFGPPELGTSNYLADRERSGSTGFGGPGELGTREPGGATGTRGAMGAPGEGGLTGDSYDSPRRNREDV